MRRRRASMSPAATALWVCLGLCAGVGLGLTVAWLIWPRLPEYTDLAHTRARYQQDYALMVSAVYEQDGDLAQAQERLAYLGDAARVRRLVSAMAEQAIEQGSDLKTKRRLARLAWDLGANSAAIIAYVATPAPDTPTPTAIMAVAPTETPSATATPRASATRTPTAPVERATATPTLTGTPTRQPEYRLVEAAPANCKKNQRPGYILVWVRDAEGKGQAGVRLRISWADGLEEFATGLHPDEDPGYADFLMSPGKSYTLAVAEGRSEVAENLALFVLEKCETEGQTPQPGKAGSWYIILQRRE